MNGWTGGQYSVYRVLFGAYLLQHFAGLLPFASELFSNAGMLADARSSPVWPLFPNLLFAADAPAVVLALVGIGCLSAVAFALGLRDRWFALVLWYVWACLFTRNPLIQNPSLAFVGWLLLAHVFVPRAPYGSFDARGREDPDGGWAMPQSLFIAAWIVMSLGYSYSGYTKLVSPSWIDGSALAHVLENPLARPGLLVDLTLALPGPLLALGTWAGLGLELAFAPLAIFRRLRPWLWLAMLGMHASLMLLIDFVDLSFGMVILHAFTFDPAWIRARFPVGADPIVYYDGSCGLCHRTVRFLLAEERTGGLRYAALASETFAKEPAPPPDLPDSVVLRTADGFRVRSAALLELGRMCGGFWRVLASVFGFIPAGFLDWGYDLVASNRHRLFRREPEACPRVRPELRGRFLD